MVDLRDVSGAGFSVTLGLAEGYWLIMDCPGLLERGLSTLWDLD